MKKYVTILAIALTTVLSSCADLGEELTYLSSLKTLIEEKYDTKEIEIKGTNNGSLVVSLSDSKFEDYTLAQKQKMAKEIGLLASRVKENNPEYKTGLVKFIKGNNYGIAKKDNKYALEKKSETEVFDMQLEENFN